MSATTPAIAFDPARPEFTAERFALLDLLRAEAPVTYLPALHVWAVTRWSEARAVLRDAAAFPSGGAFSAAVHLAPEALTIMPLDAPLLACSIINVDGDLHARLRDPLVAAFSARRVDALAPSVAADVEELLEALAAAPGDHDLMAALCRPLPLRTMCRLFGLPLYDADRLREWSNAFITFQIPGLPVDAQVGAAHGLRALERYLRDQVAEKAGAPDDGLISALVQGRAEGSHDLDDDELVADLASVFFAGHETTINTLGNAFASVLADRPVWQAVAAGEVPVEALTTELLRHDTSVIGLYRRAAADVEIGGVAVPRDATLWVAYGAANRDPALFEQPHALRFDRPTANQQMAFGGGIHYCVGAALARLQLAETITRTARRLPALRLVPHAPLVELPHHALRATLALPVLLS